MGWDWLFFWRRRESTEEDRPSNPTEDVIRISRELLKDKTLDEEPAGMDDAKRKRHRKRRK